MNYYAHAAAGARGFFLYATVNNTIFRIHVDTLETNMDTLN